MDPPTTAATIRPPTNPVDMDQSPTAMAAAAYTAAVVNRERLEKSKRTIPNNETDKDSHNKDKPTKLFKQDHPEESALTTIWTNHNLESNLEATLSLLIGEIDGLIQCGMGAFQELDVANRQLVQSREMVEAKGREAMRLNVVEDQSRASLSKLLRAVESSKSTARDSSRSAQIEARLRSEIHTLRDQRDQALTDLSSSRRKLSLAEEELRLTKSKLTKVLQEKHCMERDSRAAISLARSLDNNNSTDMNYYKRKVGELSDRLVASQRRVGELMEKLGEREKRG